MSICMVQGLFYRSSAHLRALVSVVHGRLRSGHKMGDSNPRVLSIQSHVVSGYVGNKSATFPLQVLGFEVDAINSVQFSNHTRYGYWKGQVLAERELSDLTEGLVHNGLDTYTHLLTGYTASKSFLMCIADIIKKLRAKNPNLIYLCDPVMGDEGKMYVPPELLEVYRDTILPLADIATPNQYEVELLTGQPVHTIEDAWKAVALLHKKGISTIVISSSELGSEGSLLCLGSRITDGKQCAVTLEIPKLPIHFTGTGDLFSALLLAWMWRTKNDLKRSLEYTIATMHAVLKRTHDYAKGSGVTASCAASELKLIQSKQDIEAPHVTIYAKPAAL